MGPALGFLPGRGKRWPCSHLQTDSWGALSRFPPPPTPRPEAQLRAQLWQGGGVVHVTALKQHGTATTPRHWCQLLHLRLLHMQILPSRPASRLCHFRAASGGSRRAAGCAFLAENWLEVGSRAHLPFARVSDPDLVPDQHSLLSVAAPPRPPFLRLFS